MQSLPPVATELFKRGDTYYLRLYLPGWMERRTTRRTSLKFSLRTKDIDVALYRRNLSAHALAAFFNNMKAQKPDWFSFREAWACFVRHLAGDIKWLGTAKS